MQIFFFLSFIQRHAPPMFGECHNYDVESTESIPRRILCVTTAWVPLNARNRAINLAHLFSKYVNTTYPVIFYYPIQVILIIINSYDFHFKFFFPII